jgi:hypothetical protein
MNTGVNAVRAGVSAAVCREGVLGRVVPLWR